MGWLYLYEFIGKQDFIEKKPHQSTFSFKPELVFSGICVAFRSPGTFNLSPESPLNCCHHTMAVALKSRGLGNWSSRTLQILAFYSDSFSIRKSGHCWMWVDQLSPFRCPSHQVQLHTTEWHCHSLKDSWATGVHCKSAIDGEALVTVYHYGKCIHLLLFC